MARSEHDTVHSQRLTHYFLDFSFCVSVCSAPCASQLPPYAGCMSDSRLTIASMYDARVERLGFYNGLPLVSLLDLSPVCWQWCGVSVLKQNWWKWLTNNTYGWMPEGSSPKCETINSLVLIFVASLVKCFKASHLSHFCMHFHSHGLLACAVLLSNEHCVACPEEKMPNFFLRHECGWDS